ncbi:MAG: threonylcarbamoyl-AMP synthase [Bacteroidales bacterium]|nr:threonylcarbamoyl-AMP synthase [Bacteroidales bacterium]
MLLKLYSENPNPRFIKRIVECLNDGGIIIYPTDTIYGLGCDIFNSKAIEKIAQLKGLKAEKANFSFICYSISQISEFIKPIDNTIFKFMKKNLPGPFTFIFNANNKTPKLLKSKRKTVGIRIPDNLISTDIVKELGHPILSTSIHDEDEIIEYPTDPELIYDKYKDIVDIVIDGGFGSNIPSTIIDCTNNEINVIRQGKGII